MDFCHPVRLRFPSSCHVCLFTLRWRPVSAIRQRPDPQWRQRGGHSWVRTHQQRQQPPFLTHTPPPRHPGGQGGQPLQTGERVNAEQLWAKHGWMSGFIVKLWGIYSNMRVYFCLWGPIWKRFWVDLEDICPRKPGKWGHFMWLRQFVKSVVNICGIKDLFGKWVHI